tara:strand:- start:123 stop:338 length:216 start_codon:yes stop_codon:yes gene_type:complete
MERTRATRTLLVTTRVLTQKAKGEKALAMGRQKVQTAMDDLVTAKEPVHSTQSTKLPSDLGHMPWMRLFKE